MNYKNFPKYVLRTPLFPFSFYKKLTQNTTLEEEELKKVCSDDIIKEAIFLASPSLYQEFEKWLKGHIKEKAASERIMHAVLKYISRMSSRCTPFGLFAGTTVGKFSDKTHIELLDKSKNKRHTRLDMNYLVALSQDIVKDKVIRDQLLFYPNTSIYKAGKQLRYVEYTYVKSRRVHHIVAVEDSEYLQKIISNAVKGSLLSDLAVLLVDDDITIEDASGFIDQLVESQLLISELEPSVSGPEFLDQLLPVLKKLSGTERFISELENTSNTLTHIDENIGNAALEYVTLSESLKKLETDFELKFMFQTDMTLLHKSNTISNETIRKVKKGLSLLNKLTLSPKETLISRFGMALHERYENREISLSKALDVELGIGFLQNTDSGDVSELVDDLILPYKEEKAAARDVKWSPIHSILHKKLIECIKEQQKVLIIDDKDFEDFEENWEDLPDTISSMVELVNIDGSEKIVMSSCGGSSAANLLGRFCHGDQELDAYTKEIIDLEEIMNPDKVLAEIVHLPESRVGNILMRPAFRKYEIPYLAKSILNNENQLLLDDLIISADHSGKVTLRSKKHNKNVVPHLTNAHNFSANALPIYQFLANMQTQNLRGGISFDWGPFAGEYEFLPRVEYKDVIVSSATWNVSVSEVDMLVKNMSDEDSFSNQLQKFVTDKNLPQFVLLVDGDNELLINTKNNTSMKMLLTTVKKRDRFILSEFLHADGEIVKRGEDVYTNQVVMSFFNEKKIKNTQN
ncbi:lantibiotic dehydratase family protein [Aquimarina sp. 2201CG14-23]|uniref:lantibiotic dehydratase family protein n=1 Tax=Aquimarina mycalae TaxID=3040073 RepID=UPI002477E516|nr:lantibiotic dehydratase family protein [Aquimarina sp. 2201CG14-23]MDH7447402.1 lantibiotic dehydratase family protein [Aquimarina sp. 2201CG14-23]